MRRIFKMTFKLMLLCSLLICGCTSQKRLVIIHTNDLHSHIDPERSGKYEGMGGAIERAAYIDSVRNAEGADHVLVVDAGDFSQGSSYFSILNGDLEIDIMNACEYDVITLGNHEFDNGVEEIARRLENLDAEVVCCNYDFSNLRLSDYVEPYTIIKRGGYKVGIIGVLTDVRPVVDGDIAAQLNYLGLTEVVEGYAKELKQDKKCDIVIALTHIGFGGKDSDIELAENSENIDLIIGGHSHTNLKEMKSFKNLKGNDVKVVTNYRWGLNMGQITIQN